VPSRGGHGNKAQTVCHDYCVPARIGCGFVPAVSVEPTYLCHYFVFPQNAFLSQYAVVCTVTYKLNLWVLEIAQNDNGPVSQHKRDMQTCCL